MTSRWLVDAADVQSLRQARSAALEVLRSQGDAAAEDFDACVLAISELLSNAVRHGPGGDVMVTLVWDDARPTLAVRDGGPGFPLVVALPDRGSEGGRGLFLIANLVGAPTVACDDAGCTVSVELPVRRRDTSQRSSVNATI